MTSDQRVLSDPVALAERLATLQRQLQESERRAAEQAALLDRLPFPVAIHRQERIQYLNHAAIQQLGGEAPEAFLGRSIWDFVAPSSQQLVRARLHQLYERREVAPFAHQYLRHPDGETYLCEVMGVPVVYEEAPAVLVVLRDVTERARAEEALAQSEARYRALVEEINEVIFELDAEGCFTYVSPAIERMVHLPPDQLLGQHFASLIHPEDLPALEESRQRTLQGIDEPFEFRVLLPDGSCRYIRTSSRAIFQEGQPVGLRGLATDITERKRAELEQERLIAELEAKNRELERFTYTVSHDLKSPLFTIRGFLGLLEEDALSGNLEQLRDDIQHIHNAADTMQRLLDDLLELSRIGRIASPPQAVSLTTLAREALERVTGRVTVYGGEVQVPDDLPMVYGDRNRLVEALQNLIDNAIKYGGGGQAPHVKVGATLRGDMVEAYVRDHGPGIAPEYHERVFGLFERLEGKTEGTGVGLALVHRIIEVHGGRIWIDSRGDNTGATFFFTLPRPPREDETE